LQNGAVPNHWHSAAAEDDKTKADINAKQGHATALAAKQTH
jgi:hypothetical protein